MVRYVVSALVLSFFFSFNAIAEVKSPKGKPVLAEMQSLFSLIKSLRQENASLKDQLLTHETDEVRAPAAAPKPYKNDPSLVVIDKKQYEMMVKELDRLKAQNLQKERLIVEMEQGL